MTLATGKTNDMGNDTKKDDLNGQLIQTNPNKPWYDKILDAALNINPFSSTTSVYGILVILLFAISYTLWTEVMVSHKHSLDREKDFSEYIKKRDVEVIELVSRVDQRLTDQKELVEDVKALHVKVDKLLNK